MLLKRFWTWATSPLTLETARAYVTNEEPRQAQPKATKDATLAPNEIVGDYFGEACVLTPGCLHGMIPSKRKAFLKAAVADAKERGITVDRASRIAWEVAIDYVEPELPPRVDLAAELAAAIEADRESPETADLLHAVESFTGSGISHDKVRLVVRAAMGRFGNSQIILNQLHGG